MILVLVGDSTFDGIIRLRGREDLTDEDQNVANLVWWLPLVGTEHAEAHAALVIVADVGVIDFGFERDGGWFEGVLLGQCDFDLELAVLRTGQYCESLA